MTGATIEQLITRLIHEAPAIDRTVVAELVRRLDADGRPLARSISEVVTRVGTEIDIGIALPALAMACATLCDARLTEREREAARFEIETLLPVPNKAPTIAAPDVPLSSLRRRD
jgi:hypothetical protein